MLSYPGGLYLDVKSGYSTAQQHKWFASTLAGIGVNVKVYLHDYTWLSFRTPSHLCLQFGVG